MVHAPGDSIRGARPVRQRRTLSPAVAAMLAGARRERGWSVREAARRANVTAGTIMHLEKARRAPSTVVAKAIIYGYDLAFDEAEMLRAEEVPDAGRSSPWKRARP
jgi:transcriptional regulator with XRE-family HTH domain